jgi:hypothetical protein
LKTNTAFERDGAGVVKRILWSTLVADDIEELRNRIQFHNIRLSALLTPFKLTLSTKLHEDIRRMHQDMRTGFQDMHTGLDEIIARLDRLLGVPPDNNCGENARAGQDVPAVLPQVPAWLRASFAHAAQSQAVQVNEQIRISSLIGHFANGTSKFRSAAGHDPTAPELSRYISLWKAVWIAHQLRSEISSGTTVGSELTEFALKEHEKLLLGELQRFEPARNDLLLPDEQEVENLPISEYTVWIFEPSKPRQRLLDPNPDEFRVFEGPLVDPSDTEIQHVVLYASRPQKNILRVVTTSMSKFGNAPENHQETWVDVTEARLFPTYAQPNATVFNLQLRTSPHSTSDKVFSFHSLKELHAFQQCFTSFYVKLDIPDIMKVTLKQGGFLSSMSRAQVIANYGRAQIWAHELSEQKNITSVMSSNLGPQSRHSRNLSVSNQSGSFLASNTTSSRSASRTLVNWTSVHAPSVVWREECTVLPFPELPMIVLLIGETNPGRDDAVLDAFRLLSIPLDGSVTVDQGKCDCRHDDDGCTKVIINSRTRGALKTRLYDYRTDIMKVNLAALRLPEKHRDLEGKFDVKKFDDVGRIAIEFSNVKDKKDFRERLSSVSDNYIALWQEYREHLKNVRNADYVDRRAS